MNFHDNALWQTAFVTLMDIHEALDGVKQDFSDTEGDIIEDLLASARDVAAKIADGLSRQDKRLGRELIFDAIGLVAIARTELAIAWGRGILTDETLKKIDDQYAKLSGSLQNFK
jgi:hypothetical protein